MDNRAPAKLITATAAMLALALAPTPAIAQAPAPAALSTVSLAKSEAILGSTSRLAALLAEQRGVTLPTTASATLSPASLPSRNSIHAVLRSPARPSPAVASGRPDVFGSVALQVSRTPLDYRWRAVSRSPIGAAHAAYSRSLRDLDAVARVEAVNRYVNRRVRFVDDSRQFGRADVWTTASETLRRGRGDCEDYALAKLQMLRAAGFADRDLYLVIVKDLVRRADHAVLVVRAGGRMLLLDNGTDIVADSDSVRDYRPVLTFAASGAWTHGYRRTLPPMTVASATIAPLVPAASTGER